MNIFTGVFSKLVGCREYEVLAQLWQRRREWEGTSRSRRKRKLDLFFKFFMTLAGLRLNLLLLLLADLFSVSSSKVTEITTTWVCYLHQTLVPAMLIWPSQHQVRTPMPLEFKRHFPHTRVIIDCTEFVNLQTKPNSTRHTPITRVTNTFKCFVAVSLYGAFTFVSDLWSRIVSDKFVTENSGILDLIEEGDQIMPD